MESEYNSFVGKFVKKDEPDSGKAGPSRIPTYSERIGKVTVEEFELPSCYGLGSGFAALNFSDDESSDSSDDGEIAHGISHHEKRLLRYEARLNRWNKRNPGHGGSGLRLFQVMWQISASSHGIVMSVAGMVQSKRHILDVAWYCQLGRYSQLQTIKF